MQNALVARPSRALIILWIVLLVAGIGIGAGYGLTRAVNVPWSDEWDGSLPTALGVANGTLDLATLFRQHNLARIVPSKLIVAALTAINGWYGPSEVLIVHVGILASVLIALWLLRRPGEAYPYWLLPVIGLLAFSVRQVQSLVMGFQTSWALVHTFMLALIAVIVWGRGRWSALLLAVGLATLVSFTYITGLTLWVLVIPALWWFGWRKPAHYVLWIGVAVLVTAAYFTNYQFTLAVEDFTPTRALTLFDYGSYLLMWLGAPLTASENPAWAARALIVGIGGIGLFVANLLYVWFRVRARGYALVWATVAAFVGVSGVLAAAGRTGLMVFVHPSQAISSRYVTASAWAWIALAALIGISVAHLRRNRPVQGWGQALAVLNGAAVIGMVGLTLAATASQLRVWGTPTDAMRVCVLNFPLDRNADCFLDLHPHWNRADFQSKIGELARARLNTFRGWEPPDSAISSDPLQATLIAFRSSNFRTVAITNYPINGLQERVIYQEPEGLIEQRLRIPDDANSVIYEGAIWIDPATPGVKTEFRLFVGEVSTRAEKRLYVAQFDPATQTAPQPFRIDLMAYRGQVIRLVYETIRTDGSQPIPRAMWVSPRLVTR